MDTSRTDSKLKVGTRKSNSEAGHGMASWDGLPCEIVRRIMAARGALCAFDFTYPQEDYGPNEDAGASFDFWLCGDEPEPHLGIDTGNVGFIRHSSNYDPDDECE